MSQSNLQFQKLLGLLELQNQHNLIFHQEIVACQFYDIHINIQSEG